MKNVKSLKAALFLLVVLSLNVVATSCGDDDSAPEILSVKDVQGNYAGKVKFIMATPKAEGGEEAEKPELTDVTAKVTAEEVVFEKFPVAGIIESIVGKELAPAIITAIGDVTYKLPYTAVLNDKYTEMALTFAPKSLEIEFTMPTPEVPEVEPTALAIQREGEEPAPKTKVVVTIATPEKGLFTYEGASLAWELIIDGVTVDGKALELPKAMLDFSMNKEK